MSALSKRAAEVEHELGAAWTRYHVAAQLARFMTGVLVSLMWSLHSGITDWTEVVPLLLGAAWATARQMWPQVPWSLLREHLAPGKPVPAKAPEPPGPVA